MIYKMHFCYCKLQLCRAAVLYLHRNSVKDYSLWELWWSFLLTAICRFGMMWCILWNWISGFTPSLVVLSLAEFRLWGFFFFNLACWSSLPKHSQDLTDLPKQHTNHLMSSSLPVVGSFVCLCSHLEQNQTHLRWKRHPRWSIPTINSWDTLVLFCVFFISLLLWPYGCFFILAEICGWPWLCRTLRLFGNIIKVIKLLVCIGYSWLCFWHSCFSWF